MKQLYNLDDDCKPDIKQVARELRKTHYSLGHDPGNYLTQYIHDYPPYPFGQNGPSQDDLALRRSNFKLGDYPTPYDTTYNDQNLRINEGKPAQLDEETKNDLRASHFGLGSGNPDLHSIYQTEYTDKSGQPVRPLKSDLRSTNYKLGDDKIDYIPEYKDRYTTPPLPKYEKKKSDLQSSHYNFGTNHDPISSTHFDSYVPHPLTYQQSYDPKLAGTNFKLGDDYPTLNSIYRETYVKKPIEVSNLNEELAKDLRKHHFPLGNAKNDYGTIYKKDYTEQPIENLKGIDDQLLRGSHWNIGGAPLGDNYDTTYNTVHTPKKLDPNNALPNKTFKSSLNFTGPGKYNTEFRDNYIPYDTSGIDPKLLKNIMNDIKNSHFNIGNDPNNWSTTNNDAYKFDPNKAANARGNLDKNLLNDLRATHYKLGYLGDPNKSTYEANYIPWPLEMRAATDPGLRLDNFGKSGPFDGDTTYHADYTPKPIQPPCPPDEEEKGLCDC
jgi:hypothetical protein